MSHLLLRLNPQSLLVPHNAGKRETALEILLLAIATKILFLDILCKKQKAKRKATGHQKHLWQYRFSQKEKREHRSQRCHCPVVRSYPLYN